MTTNTFLNTVIEIWVRARSRQLRLRLKSASLAIPCLYALPNTIIPTATLHEFVGSCSIAAILAGYINGGRVLVMGLEASFAQPPRLLLALHNVQLSVNVHNVLAVCHMREAPRSFWCCALGKEL